MKTVGKTHMGMVRKNNQDNFLCQDKHNGISVFAVADGLGGHNAGEVASEYVVEELASYFTIWENDAFLKDTEGIVSFIQSVNSRIYEMSLTSEKLSGMGTTLTLCVTDGKEACIFQVGDSRAYRMGETLSQITKDHSLVQYMIDQGQITPEEGLHHPQKNIITRALGTDAQVEVDVYRITLNPGEKLLLCSDGLTNMVEDSRIASILHQNHGEAAVDAFIEEANKSGGTDNITVVLYEG